LLVALLTHTAPPGRRAEDYWSAAPAHPIRPGHTARSTRGGRDRFQV
jgi:hypothetical protein